MKDGAHTGYAVELEGTESPEKLYQEGRHTERDSDELPKVDNWRSKYE